MFCYSQKNYTFREQTNQNRPYPCRKTVLFKIFPPTNKGLSKIKCVAIHSVRNTEAMKKLVILYSVALGLFMKLVMVRYLYHSQKNYIFREQTIKIDSTFVEKQH